MQVTSVPHHIVKLRFILENEFDSDETEPFPFDGQPMIVTPSPTATNKKESELQDIKKELYKFSRNSPALFEFSDDESQSPVQVDELRKLSDEVARFEEASRKLTQVMTKNTACMKQLLDRKENKKTETSRGANNEEAEQKRSTPERCTDCGKIKRRIKPQPANNVRVGQKKIKISPDTVSWREQRGAAENDRFRPTIDAWLKRWETEDEENQ